MWNNSLLSRIISDFAALRSNRFAPDAAKRYRRDQITGVVEQTQLLLLGNTLFAPILAYQAWPSGSLPLLVGWALLMVVGSWALFFWTRPLQNCTGEVADMRRMKMRAFIDGSFWVLGMACVYPHTAGDSKAIVGIIITGAIALGTFGYSRSAGPGLIYLAVTSLGCGIVALITGLTVGTPSDSLVLLMAIFAFIALAKSVLERGHGVLQSFKYLEKLSEKTEVVELLLKDYEAQATEWLWQTDASGRLIAAPDLIIQYLDEAEADPTKRKRPMLRRIGDVISPESTDAFERMAHAVRNQFEFHDIVLALRNPESGGLRWVAVKGRPQFDNGVYQGFRGIVADTTQAVEAERKVQYLAAFDSLTGLYNRNSVQQRLCGLDPAADKITAFLIDLDGFKQINDSYGHDIGDDLLRAVSERLNKFATNGAWAARLAGDEFLLIVPDTENTNTSVRLAWGQEVCDRLSEPFRLDEFELQISASVGIARFPSDTVKGHDLLSLCDLALYDAKNGGRDRAHLFKPSMLEQLNERITVIERLKRAVGHSHIQLYYQPQHRLSDGALIGFEALARWTDEDLGPIGPDVFIPIAEQTGLIVELGGQLLHSACMHAKGWYDTLGPAAPVVSVNISPVQFARTDVAQLVAGVLAETGIPPELIEVEVTESVLISDKKRVADTLEQLSAMGVSIALDDFGTGYSSLSYLKALPLNRLKIDQSFVRDLSKDSESPIVSTVIQLGHNLNLSVIAEGVETKTQVEQLLQLGCDDGQGFYYGRPMTLKDANRYVEHLATSNALDQTG